MRPIVELTSILEQLCVAEKPVRILRTLAWPSKVREDFFAAGAKRLPEIEYPTFDPVPTLEKLKLINQRIGHDDSACGQWLQRLTLNIENGALLLANMGRPSFLTYSTALYGQPTAILPDGNTTVLGLAESFDEVLSHLDNVDLGVNPIEFNADELADKMGVAVAKMFGEQAPRVQVVDELSANALAGAKRIRIRRGVTFSDKDVAQLIHHEAYIHVATSLNGREQKALPILARSHPGTTRTQEGLAVFAEFITGSMELSRLRRLTDRVIAIQMAVEGADFLDVYAYFLDRSKGDKIQSFENARRVFRGGPITGGAPFTKDIVYLEGLLRVHNFLRIAVSMGRADLLRLLFCGKVDIEDISAIAELAAEGHCLGPRFLPPWAADLRFLLSYLAYSSFLNKVDLSHLRNHYASLMQASPVTDVT